MRDLGIIYLHPFSKSLGTATATLGFARQLAQRGLIIHIFSLYEPDGQFEPNIYVHNLNLNFLPDFTYDFLRFFYSIPLISRNLILNVRFMRKNALMIAKAIIDKIEEKNLNIDLIESEELHTYEASIDVGRRLDIPSVARIHNLNVEEFADLRLIDRQGKQYNALKKYTEKNLDEMDLIITLTEYARTYLNIHFDVDIRKIRCIPIGVDEKFVKSCTDSYEEHVGSKRPCRIIYSGSLTDNENVDLFINSINIKKDLKTPVEYHLTGKGGKKSYYEKLCKRLNHEVHFGWFELKTEYRDFLSKGYIGVIPWADVPSRRIGFPMKLLDYLSAGLPVVATKIGGWSEIIESETIGYNSDLTDVAFSEAIESLVNLPEMAYKMSENALRIVRNEFSWERIMNLYEKEVLQAIV